MRGDDRRFRGGNRVPESLVGDVRDVHHHAQPIHLQHDLLAEIGEPVVMLNFGIVNVARGISPFIGVRPRERHVAHAQPVVVAQQVHVVFNRVPALDSHQRSQFVLAMGPLNICYGKSHHHAIRMTRRLLVYGVDQIERVPRKVALIRFRIHPDGEKLRSKIAAARLV